MSKKDEHKSDEATKKQDVKVEELEEAEAEEIVGGNWPTNSQGQYWAPQHMGSGGGYGE